ncbi:hypothetical protein UCRPA7_4191 [Phaeoacremonium minimum UCRPA7]|uniref:Uncharacterized protein n=1 Tax=Phaeoacremonium minimum (strain UCR-PA7) TaxID=1286976 RepID=R8BLP7_PHAM7|nr:hypothetical protein UCRPA7_4191 [Phaeoacremonium minimum UCRPA7]EOO00301.1 hypothetical protein UCRPA7_4191 [Phaeoacremonium minimum UCRPA7]
MKSSLALFSGLLALVGAVPAGKLPARSLPPPDIDAIKSVSPKTFKSYPFNYTERGDESDSKLSKRWDCNTRDQTIFTWGDTDNGGKGITITNADSDWRGFYFYHNNCDYVPYKYVWINAGETQFVSVPDGFEGRVVRGTDEWNLGGVPRPLASWFEFSFDQNGWIWGDVSLIRGCDGSVLMWSLDGSGAWKGFTQWILDGAPSGAYDQKPSGNWVLKATENWDGSINTIPRDWELQQVGADYVYVDDYHGNPVITSTNGRFGTYWPGGRL